MSESAVRLDARLREIRRIREDLAQSEGGKRDPLLSAHIRQIDRISDHLSSLGQDPDGEADIDLDDLKRDQVAINEHRSYLSGARI